MLAELARGSASAMAVGAPRARAYVAHARAMHATAPPAKGDTRAMAVRLAQGSTRAVAAAARLARGSARAMAVAVRFARSSAVTGAVAVTAHFTRGSASAVAMAASLARGSARAVAVATRSTKGSIGAVAVRRVRSAPVQSEVPPPPLGQAQDRTAHNPTGRRPQKAKPSNEKRRPPPRPQTRRPIPHLLTPKPNHATIAPDTDIPQHLKPQNEPRRPIPGPLLSHTHRAPRSHALGSAHPDAHPGDRRAPRP
ncbi:hypothetical protein CYMTET_32570 [Cymbomonas tetramitiformis]|uniref:Uncharacterized protein n=1 Tax=Cymbomonas tetramitiformis TaxID=36881 RepID=A0AAE0FET2_9CHLO|nr:hypothetical protein CYMTET_32570 [Cymbomonas tetramitiformis]